MSEIKLGIAVPHLPVADAIRSLEFYRDELGMQIVQDDTAVGFGGHDACFACLARNSFLLCENWHDDSDYKLTMAVWLNSLADLQALHAECRCYC